MISGKKIKDANPQKSNKPTFEDMEGFFRNSLMRCPTVGEVEAGRRIVERLPKNQHEKLTCLMLTTGRYELELYERLLGKNTILAAKVVVDEYINRFGEVDGSAKEIMQILIPRGRFNSWEELDLNITLFCRKINQDQESYIYKYKNSAFFDNARFLLRELPHQKDYEQEKEVYNFERCSFCWRHVPRKSTQKKRPLCGKHSKLKNRDSEYRRRKRLTSRVNKIRDNLVATVPNLRWVHRNTEIDPQDFYVNMCVNKKGELPYLAKYLASLQLPLTCPKDIVLALEHGVDLDEMLPVMRQAWERNIEVMANNLFRQYHNTIFYAEAWLQADVECKPRGRGGGLGRTGV